MRERIKIRRASAEAMANGCPPGWYLVRPAFGFACVGYISGFPTWQSAMDEANHMIKEHASRPNIVNTSVSSESWAPWTMRGARV